MLFRARDACPKPTSETTPNSSHDAPDVAQRLAESCSAFVQDRLPVLRRASWSVLPVCEGLPLRMYDGVADGGRADGGEGVARVVAGLARFATSV
jgi:hypothetical protein